MLPQKNVIINDSWYTKTVQHNYFPNPNAGFLRPSESTETPMSTYLEFHSCTGHIVKRRVGLMGSITTPVKWFICLGSRYCTC